MYTCMMHRTPTNHTYIYIWEVSTRSLLLSWIAMVLGMQLPSTKDEAWVHRPILLTFSRGNHDTQCMVSIRRFRKNIELARVSVKKHIYFCEEQSFHYVVGKIQEPQYIGQIHYAIWMSHLCQYHVHAMYDMQWIHVRSMFTRNRHNGSLQIYCCMFLLYISI